MAEQPDTDGAYQVNMQAAPVDDVPQRVVSLVPGLTEALFDLDLGDRVVGVSDDCTRPADRVQAAARMGRAKRPDLERVLAARPDLVLMDGDEHRPEDIETLRAAGVPVWVFRPRTVFEALNGLWSLMDVCDHAVMVPRVREIERAYDYSLAAAGAQSPVRVFVLFGCDPWVTCSRDTFAHDVLRVCGGANVFADLPLNASEDREPPSGQASGMGEGWPGYDRRYPVITMDEMVDAQPDVILLPHPWSESNSALLGQRDVPAVRSARVYPIEGDLLTWYGTRIGYALRDLPGLLMGAE